MLIWRVQNSEGVGPYSDGSEVCQKLVNVHTEDCAHPAPCDDRVLEADGRVRTFERVISDRIGWNENLRFGFVSESIARTWFDGFWDDLAADDFSLVCVEVEDDKVIVAQSGQVAYAVN